MVSLLLDFDIASKFSIFSLALDEFLTYLAMLLNFEVSFRTRFTISSEVSSSVNSNSATSSSSSSPLSSSSITTSSVFFFLFSIKNGPITRCKECPIQPKWRTFNLSHALTPLLALSRITRESFLYVNK